MNRVQSLRAVYHRQLKWLNRFIYVRCSQTTCEPEAFRLGYARLKVIEIFECAKESIDLSAFAYLIRASDGQIYCLCRRHVEPCKKKCWWWVSFRLLNRQELMEFEKRRRMLLVNMELKLIADRHGHLCPDLAIGWRIGKLARRLITESGTIEAGCMSCALEALSQMGNWHIRINPKISRHIYKLKDPNSPPVEIRVPDKFTWFSGEIASLETKLFKNEATIDEAAKYQVEIDRQVEKILRAPDTELFGNDILPENTLKINRQISRGGSSISAYCLMCGAPIKDNSDTHRLFCPSCRRKLS